MKRIIVGLAVIAAALSITAVAFPSSGSGTNFTSASSLVPPQLAGQWGIAWQGGTEYLTLADSRFMFFFNYPIGGGATGAVSVSGDTITFYSSNVCNGPGTYQWTLTDGGLTFVQLTGSNDPCLRGPILTSGTWTRR